MAQPHFFNEFIFLKELVNRFSHHNQIFDDFLLCLFVAPSTIRCHCLIKRAFNMLFPFLPLFGECFVVTAIRTLNYIFALMLLDEEGLCVRGILPQLIMLEGKRDANGKCSYDYFKRRK